jgi:hypothetical protein
MGAPRLEDILSADKELREARQAFKMDQREQVRGLYEGVGGGSL